LPAASSLDANTRRHVAPEMTSTMLVNGSPSAPQRIGQEER
jgi:hypothetical protein